jgi:UDPglucose 6-dehydrogenase
MFDIAQGLGVDFNKTREIWLADPRIGRSHTFIYEEKRGFSGKCLPKDISSIKNQAANVKVDTLLLDTIVEKNDYFLNKNKK